VRPRTGDARLEARQRRRRHRHLLLRPPRAMATRDQREHQRAATPILSPNAATCPSTAPSASSGSPTNSTTGPANASATPNRSNRSDPSCCTDRQNLPPITGTVHRTRLAGHRRLERSGGVGRSRWRTQVMPVGVPPAVAARRDRVSARTVIVVWGSWRCRPTDPVGSRAAAGSLCLTSRITSSRMDLGPVLTLR
jgi:hypothetical protein